jgi:hypothetical protein
MVGPDNVISLGPRLILTTQKYPPTQEGAPIDVTIFEFEIMF